MEILYLLIPMSVVLALAVIGVFAWALNAGQFDDVEYEGARILLDADHARGTRVDMHQAVTGPGAEQST
jgi:cbb3-type cytochrome oxidase maturation protein